MLETDTFMNVSFLTGSAQMAAPLKRSASKSKPTCVRIQLPWCGDNDNFEPKYDQAMDMTAGSKKPSISTAYVCVHTVSPRRCTDYSGITNHLAARFAAHVAGKGARFTRANPPVCILGAHPFAGRSEASKAEWAIKQLPRAKKLAFLAALEVSAGGSA